MISRWGDKGDGDFGEFSFSVLFEEFRRLISMLDKPSAITKYHYNICARLRMY